MGAELDRGGDEPWSLVAAVQRCEDRETYAFLEYIDDLDCKYLHSLNSMLEEPATARGAENVSQAVSLMLSQRDDLIQDVKRFEAFMHALPKKLTCSALAEALLLALSERGHSSDDEAAANNRLLGLLLCYASDRECGPAVTALLKAGVDEDTRDDGGCSPIFYAAANGSTAVLELLIRAEARLNLLDGSGCSPLGAACQEGRVGCARILLEARADVDGKSEAGGVEYTPLMLACDSGHANLVSILLENWADPSYQLDSSRVSKGEPRTAMEFAKAAEDGGSACVQFLVDGEQQRDLVKRAAGNSWIGKGEKIYDEGEDVTAKLGGAKTTKQILKGAGRVVTYKEQLMRLQIAVMHVRCSGSNPW